MDSALAKRRYRFGRRLFTGSAVCFRWWLVATAVLTLPASLVTAQAIETGLWSVAATVLQWFAAAVAGMLIYTNLPVWISRGCTRREITVAFAVFAALTTLALTAYLVAGFAAEHALFALVGDAPRPWSETIGLGARYLLITPIYFFTGTLIGAAAARFAGRAWFTAAVLIGATGHYAGILALEFGTLGDWAPAPWAGVALAVTAVLVAACALTLRSVPVQAKRA
ncbi:hypothetical protein K3N28_15200 [Glycomyces sp. TRM65418]|uniref:hypothetical protein n=1 Tax=Glycomyces sp. TRM65418 TaxID=2867006 RepID=UPI001CE53C10|nr:hypothetical protein [Glycomyces sp. TRM65418]MCC3764412.1 hypothetical protein [Glycomyces sp. TRM65418]QZD54088.1 hypothetical protein K3N28_15125 [Glycomyces sp. TRM65418]